MSTNISVEYFLVITDFADDVPHGAELKYIWDDGTNSDPTKFSPEDALMQKKILTVINNFIRHG